MKHRLDELVRIAFRRWKMEQPSPEVHPDEETFCQALQGTLSHGELRAFQDHLAMCDACADIIAACLDTAAVSEDAALPGELRESAAQAVAAVFPPQEVLEVSVRIKDAALELLKAAGDVLIGQEYVPAAVVRGRGPQEREFRGGLTLVRDCGQLRCQVIIERSVCRQAAGLRLSVKVSERSGAACGQGRFTLVHEGRELESLCSDNGSAVFESVPVGISRVVFEDKNGRRAQICLEVLR